MIVYYPGKDILSTYLCLKCFKSDVRGGVTLKAAVNTERSRPWREISPEFLKKRFGKEKLLVMIDVTHNSMVCFK